MFLRQQMDGRLTVNVRLLTLVDRRMSVSVPVGRSTSAPRALKFLQTPARTSAASCRVLHGPGIAAIRGRRRLRGRQTLTFGACAGAYVRQKGRDVNIRHFWCPRPSLSTSPTINFNANVHHIRRRRPAKHVVADTSNISTNVDVRYPATSSKPVIVPVYNGRPHIIL